MGEWTNHFIPFRTPAEVIVDNLRTSKVGIQQPRPSVFVLPLEYDSSFVLLWTPRRTLDGRKRFLSVCSCKDGRQHLRSVASLLPPHRDVSDIGLLLGLRCAHAIALDVLVAAGKLVPLLEVEDLSDDEGDLEDSPAVELVGGDDPLSEDGQASAAFVEEQVEAFAGGSVDADIVADGGDEEDEPFLIVRNPDGVAWVFLQLRASSTTKVPREALLRVNGRTKRIACMACTFRGCAHKVALAAWIDHGSGQGLLVDQDDQEDEVSQGVPVLPTFVIPVAPTIDERGLARDVGLRGWTAFASNLIIVEIDGQSRAMCPKCSGFFVSETITPRLLADCGISLPIKIEVLECQSCRLTIVGTNPLIFFPSNIAPSRVQWCFDMTLLRRHLLEFVLTGQSVSGFFRVHKEHSVDMVCSELTYRSAWNNFITRYGPSVDPSEAFICRRCGQYPSSIICDGTALVLNSDYVPTGTGTGSRRDSDSRAATAVRPIIKFEDYAVLSTKAARVALHRLNSAAANSDPVSRDEALRLLDIVRDNKNRDTGNLVADYVNSVFVTVGAGTSASVEVPCECRDLLRCLCAHTPISGWLPLDSKAIRDFLDTAAAPTQSTINFPLLDALRHDCPAVALAATGSLKSLEKLCALIDHLMVRLHQQRDRIHWHSNGPARSVDGTGPGALHESPVACFPCWPRIRQRGQYLSDTTGRVPIDCRKVFGKAPSNIWTSGIFTFLCAHGVCYGYEVMKDAESVNVPFTILYERFPRAPEMVVFDHACKFHIYTIAREPHFFENCAFKIDRFHWHNHTGCASGYNLDAYPQHHMLNSEANEQANSLLKKLRGQLSLMKLTTFKASLNVFLAAYNSRKNSVLS